MGGINTEDTATLLTFGDGGWSATINGIEPAREPWAATMLALANGAIGVRGTIEERAAGAATTFLAHAWERTPIGYHERFKGFAEATDTRVPVAEPLAITVTIDGAAVDFSEATAIACARTIDFRTGMLLRETCWRLTDGRTLRMTAERLVPLDAIATLARRIAGVIENGPGTVEIMPLLAPAPVAARQSDDPRIGVSLHTGGFARETAEGALVERLRGSGVAVASAQRVTRGADGCDVFTAYAVGSESADILATRARAAAAALADIGLGAAARWQRATLDAFWSRAAIDVTGDERTAAALRFNLFHLFRSAGRDGRSSAAAKGLTGEGYEGHYFWDTEVFMLPVLAVLAPEIARAMLTYRYATLPEAIANARALNHDHGALYAWRTIAGRECSAHYPSGSAEYHVNAAIAFGVGAYDQATGDTSFLVEMGAEMLVETARLWLALGEWSDRTGEFCIRGVTGPDEYTALIDNNWYTNRMAQKHLRLACDTVARVSAAAPGEWVRTASRIGFASDELDAFSAAADAMRLPYDTELDLDAQDDSFLAKPRWDLANTPRDRFPLLLHFHPMTLYRHQVAKQADLVLGLVLAGEEVPLERKRRDFDYYDNVTAHDSTLSACSFAILASEVGRRERAMEHFRAATFVDIDDLHGNTGHGVHMASLAGSWMALVWGFGGFRPDADAPSFAPMLPNGWDGYRFGLLWRGAELRVAVDAGGATYRNAGGANVSLRHDGGLVILAPGQSWSGALAAR